MKIRAIFGRPTYLKGNILTWIGFGMFLVVFMGMFLDAVISGLGHVVLFASSISLLVWIAYIATASILAFVGMKMAEDAPDSPIRVHTEARLISKKLVPMYHRQTRHEVHERLIQFFVSAGAPYSEAKLSMERIIDRLEQAPPSWRDPATIEGKLCAEMEKEWKYLRE